MPNEEADETNMINEVTGDILLTEADVIAHGVAPNDSFDHDLALSLRKQWPAMYKDFRHYCKVSHPKEGSLWTWATVDHKRIVNLFTQHGDYSGAGKPGKAETKYINSALRELRHLIETEHFGSIALPKIGTGVGGLDWEEVKPLIEKHLGDLNIPIYIYTTYHSGQKATE